jgi:hypothetical protein
MKRSTAKGGQALRVKSAQDKLKYCFMGNDLKCWATKLSDWVGSTASVSDLMDNPWELL